MVCFSFYRTTARMTSLQSKKYRYVVRVPLEDSLSSRLLTNPVTPKSDLNSAAEEYFQEVKTSKQDSYNEEPSSVVEKNEAALATTLASVQKPFCQCQKMVKAPKLYQKRNELY